MPHAVQREERKSSSVLRLLSLVAWTAFVLFWATGAGPLVGPALVAALALSATYFQSNAKLHVFAFTFWVFTLVAAAMFYPAAFDEWGGYQLSGLIVPLIQIIMFGMGATLSLSDFGRALSMPRAVLAGIFLQFTVMPLVGWSVAALFQFPPEVAAGVILIGSCSGGVASNVMVFLSRGNVALSVTMTACSTLLAPVMTPLAMKLLAGRLIAIDFLSMMWSIIEMIILPIGAGLIAHYLLREKRHWIDRVLPVVSMASICFIIAIIAADSRDQLLTVGFALLAAALLHNLAGYLFGYTLAGVLGLKESDRRTVAFEVGMQNGGMGVALATNVLQSSAAALAPAIFGTWMNVTGSTLASWWRDRPPAPPSPVEVEPRPTEARGARVAT